MGKPYSDLEKRAIAILAGGGNPATSQDQAVAKYWAWKINPSNSSHKLPTTSVRSSNRKKDDVAITPFSINLNANIFAEVAITKRSQTALNSLSAVKTLVAHKTLNTTTDQALPLKSFQPAYVYWRTGEAATSAERTSRITGRKYKSYYTASDEGFMVPFGKSTSTDEEAKRQKMIKAAFTNTNLISFTPERYRG